jgi:hypothetical protein
MKARFTVTVADNGWIVRVTNYPAKPQPPGPEKAPPELIVFNDWQLFTEWIGKFSKGDL